MSSTQSDQAVPSPEGESRAATLTLFLPGLAALVQSGRAMVLEDQATRSLIMIQGFDGSEEDFRQLMNKEGPLPASKASIEAMPVVKVTEEGHECPICLVEYELGGEAKEMPCKHKFHLGCIDKWLGLHGSCPVCRYKMPEEEKEKKASGDVDGGEGEGRRFGGIMILIASRHDASDSAVDNNPSASDTEMEDLNTD